MKVLLTGKNGYIAQKSAAWLLGHDGDFSVDFLDMRSDAWKSEDFSSYDAIVHTAAVVHVKCSDSGLYDRINNQMTYELAVKAKESKVKHFIFLSSMSVYSTSNGIKAANEIDLNTITNPVTDYGRSKLNAEIRLQSLADDTFKPAIVRPPMVYGPGAKGNYQRLSKLSKKLPVIPRIHNQRSMIFVDNLTEFIRGLLINERSGIFFPQNSEYVSTCDMMAKIRKCHNKKTLTIRLFNPLIRSLAAGKGPLSGTVSKLYGNLVYHKEISNFEFDYNVVSFEDSIRLCEQGKVN